MNTPGQREERYTLRAVVRNESVHLLPFLRELQSQRRSMRSGMLPMIAVGGSSANADLTDKARIK